VSHLLSVLHQAGANTLDGASYTYDPAGNRTVKTNDLNGITSNYTYDPLYELTQVTQGVSTTESYSYDAVGNRLSSSGVPTYNYNSSNELTSNSSGSYAYDANGNTLSDPQGRGFTWDFENRLTQAAVPGANGGTTTFKYDPFGRRIQKSGPLGTTNYSYDLDSVLEEMDQSGNVLARYTQGRILDEPLAMYRSASTSYYEADGLGSISSLTNSNAGLAESYTYDSYGSVTGSTGTLTNPFQYTGREFDPETNLYYYRNRSYDVSSGRFNSEDPLRFSAGVNFYRYVKNSPVDFVDPFGLKVQKCCRTPQINWWANFLIKLTGQKHCFIKTDKVTAGMGPANGGPLPACPLFTQTAVTDHSAEVISPGECTDVPGVDEDCVNKSLGVGTPLGRWSPWNQCNSFANGVLEKCSTCKKTSTYPEHEHFMSGW
jgi:RHS repeat-associated protein